MLGHESKPMVQAYIHIAFFFETMFPAAEKRRSEGVEVAGMHKNDLASDARVGYFASFNFHHDRRLSVFEMGCSPKYISTCHGTTDQISLVAKSGSLHVI